MRYAHPVAAMLLAACACTPGNDEPAPDDAGPTCPTPSGPTEHEGPIEADEVWTAEGSPHIVARNVRIRGGATLTIEPCAEVRIAEGESLEVGQFGEEATLLMEGTAERPIHVAGVDGARWGAVWINENATGRFTHVSFEDGGGETTSGSRQATLYASAPRDGALKELVHASDVTITGSLGPGVYLEGLAGFTSSSTNLTITESGGEASPHVVLASALSASTLPAGSYTGNFRDEIGLVDPTDIEEPVTFANHGVPYVLLGNAGTYLRIASAERDDASLTLEPGVVLKFSPGTYLWVGSGLEDDPDYGALIAAGTEEEPVVFTSAAETPAAGDWIGIQFRGGDISSQNRLEHARVEYAGGDCSCAGFSCPPEGWGDEAAILFLDVAPSESFLHQTTIAHSAGHGVLRGWSQRDDDWPGVSTSFLDGNTFEEVAGCLETLYRDEQNACPVTPPCP